MGASLKVLVVEDNPDDAELVLRMLRNDGYLLDHACVDNPDALKTALKAQAWHLVISDYTLPQMRGPEVLRHVQESHGRDVPVIFVSGTLDDKTAIELMRAGAHDYLLKDNLARLSAAVKRELAAAQVRRHEREVEKKLDDERHLLTRIMTSSPDGICVEDLQRRIVRLNEAQRTFFGVAPSQEVIGKTTDQLVSPKLAQTWRQEDEEVLATGEPLIDHVEEAVQQDGTVRWYSTTKAALRSQTGAITGLLRISRDVTERKLHEQLLQQFIATVSHELRTPMTSIMGSIALVAGGTTGALSDSTARLLKIATTNCQRLIRLINDILDIERIESGKMVFNMQPVDVRAVIEHEIDAIKGFAKGYDVRVQLDPAAGDGVVEADTDRLAQVVNNLLSNAVKYSPRGAEVIVGIENRQGLMVRFSVRDHGPGIPDDHTDRVFEKFVQVDTNDARQRGGTGLGLSIVKQIVERLNGLVCFEAAPGGGTIFYVTLPLAQEAMETGSRPQQRAACGGR